MGKHKYSDAKRRARRERWTRSKSRKKSTKKSMKSYPLEIIEHKIKGKIFATSFKEALNILCQISFEAPKLPSKYSAEYILVPGTQGATVFLSRKPE